MLLGKEALLQLHKKHTIVTPYTAEFVKSVHIDLRLGSDILVYNAPIDLREPACWEPTKLIESGYILDTGDFIVGATFEQVYIPEGYWGLVETKGNIARAGLSVHNSDGHIDPGYKGVVTLEIKNNNTVPVTIYPGILIAQLFLFEVKGGAPVYEGRYQNSKAPTPFLPDKLDLSK